MKYRTLGRTGLSVSEVGFGCGNVGGLMVRGTEEEQLAAVNKALELGINYFDTAPVYGNTLSETNLGKVLKQITSDVIVATKVRIEKEDAGDIEGCVMRSIEASLERLQRDSVHILQLHTPISSTNSGERGQWNISLDQVLGPGGVVDAFKAVQSQKLTKYIGITGLGETSALHETVKSGQFDLVQCYYNLLNPSAGQSVPQGFKGQDFNGLIDVASENGMGVVIIRVMAGGALGGRQARTGYASPNVGGALANGAKYSRDEMRAGKLDFMLDGNITSIPQAAVRFALDQDNVSTVLVGYSDTDQLEEAASCSEKKPLPEETMSRLRELWANDFDLE